MRNIFRTWARTLAERRLSGDFVPQKKLQKSHQTIFKTYWPYKHLSEMTLHFNFFLHISFVIHQFKIGQNNRNIVNALQARSSLNMKVCSCSSSYDGDLCRKRKFSSQERVYIQSTKLLCAKTNIWWYEQSCIHLNSFNFHMKSWFNWDIHYGAMNDSIYVY